MAKKPLHVIRDSLRSYADRGVFRGFNEVKAGLGKHAFTFVWLTRHPMEFSYNTQKQELRFKNLLPNVPAQSALYTDLKRFVRERYDGELPPHCRIDRKRAEVACSNRGGSISLALTVKNNQYEYGVNKIINLTHELFVHLQDVYADYLAENFDLSEE